MTRNDADRLDKLQKLVRQAIEKLETFDDAAFGWEPGALLQEVERHLEKVSRAHKGLSRPAPVLEFSRPRRGTR